MTHTLRWTLLLAALLAGCPMPERKDAGPSFDYPEDDAWTLWHVQTKGTHNSYHRIGGLDIPPWHYSHLPLDQQAELQGVRAQELDVQFELDAGVLRVFHVGIVDEATTCATFRECLAVIKVWSDAHPAHQPLFLQVEPKSGYEDGGMDAFFSAVEGAVLATWGRERLITPDLVQGDAGSLAEALRDHGWPSLRQTRGKLLLAFDDTGEVRRAYLRDGGLRGRLFFVDSAPADPFAGVAVLNDPVEQAERIRAALAAHMLVRTRADSDSTEPATNDRTRLEAALASGAHFISTDYPGPQNAYVGPDGGFVYYVDIPGGTPSRCNPVTSLDAGRPCRSAALEDPAFMR